MIKATSRQWLDEHLETFVKPYLKSVPDIDQNTRATWTPRLVTCLHACWKQAKRLAQDRTILLPGRDVWLFEVLARMEGWPTVFRKDFSTPVAKSKFITDDWSKHHAFDTGYSGSVCKALKCERWHLISWSGCPAPAVSIAPMPIPSIGGKKKGVTVLNINAGTPKPSVLFRKNSELYTEHQLFPYGQRGRACINPATGMYTGPSVPGSSIFSLACMLESHAKYWERAEVQFKDPNKYPDPEAIALKPQVLSQPAVFTNAAMMTRLIAESCL